MRSSFDPYAGPQLLIFAFEAVVIGGIGSLWGTLVGGIVLGVAQNVGAQIDPQWSDPRGAHRLPRDPRRRGSCSSAVEEHGGFAVVFGRALVTLVPRRALEPDVRRGGGRRRRGRRRPRLRAVVPRRERRRQAHDALRLPHPRRDVERARRLCRTRLDRAAGLLRPRRVLHDPAHEPRRLRLSVARPRRAHRGARRDPDVVLRAPPARRRLRDRHVGGRGDVPPAREPRPLRSEA